MKFYCCIALFALSNLFADDEAAIPAVSQPSKLELVESDSLAEVPANSTPESLEAPSRLTLNPPISESDALSTPLREAPAGTADDEDKVSRYNYDLINNPTINTFDLSCYPLDNQSKTPICLITMPRSGTNFLISVLSFGFSDRKQWCGRFIGPPKVFENATIDPDLLKGLIENKGISWCHASADPCNLSLLTHLRVPVVLHMRDPRQAILSWIHHESCYRADLFDLSWDERVNYYLCNIFPEFVKWTDQWLKTIQSNSELNIHLSFYESMMQDLSTFLKDLLSFLNFPTEQFDWSYESVIADWKHSSPDQIHYRNGTVDEWRTVFTDEQKKYMLDLMPDYFFTMCPWTP